MVERKSIESAVTFSGVGGWMMILGVFALCTPSIFGARLSSRRPLNPLRSGRLAPAGAPGCCKLQLLLTLFNPRRRSRWGLHLLYGRFDLRRARLWGKENGANRTIILAVLNTNSPSLCLPLGSGTLYFLSSGSLFRNRRLSRFRFLFQGQRGQKPTF